MEATRPVVLTEAERKYAQEVVNDKVTAKTFKKRAQVLLALDTSVGVPETQERIAIRVGVCRMTIYTTIQAFHEEGLEASLRSRHPKFPIKSQSLREKWRRGLSLQLAESRPKDSEDGQYEV